MKKQFGATRLEIVVVMIMIAMLSGWLLHTLQFYQELAEKTSVETTVMNMRSGMRLKIADLIIKGEADQQKSLVKQNPVVFLQKPPLGYLGELKSVPEDLPKGSWYFDVEMSQLVYVPKISDHLIMKLDLVGDVPVFLRWQVLVPEKQTSLLAVDVELLTTYRWF